MGPDAGFDIFTRWDPTFEIPDGVTHGSLLRRQIESLREGLYGEYPIERGNSHQGLEDKPSFYRGSSWDHETGPGYMKL